jgi:competence protein ComEA
VSNRTARSISGLIAQILLRRKTAISIDFPIPAVPALIIHDKEFMMNKSTYPLALTLLLLPLLAFAGPVNINTADADTIAAELDGVGLAKAQAIVDYRKKHGPFRSVDDLSLVKGIGDRTVEINRSDIRISDTKKP